MKIFIKEINYNSVEYFEEVKFRDKYLREPLGLKFTEQQLAEEIREIHFGAYYNNKLAGCLILKPVSMEIIIMRQVAVDESLRGLGIGKMLVAHSEEYSKSKGYNKIIMRARDTAVKFYEKLGYTKEGEMFIEVTIPHYKMFKYLND
jgi:ribosomal protein S18 acetylase RimI-like enzyme